MDELKMTLEIKYSKTKVSGQNLTKSSCFFGIFVRCLLDLLANFGLASFAGWAKYFLCRQKVFKNLVSKKTRLVIRTKAWSRMHRYFMFQIFYLSFVE